MSITFWVQFKMCKMRQDHLIIWPKNSHLLYKQKINLMSNSVAKSKSLQETKTCIWSLFMEDWNRHTYYKRYSGEKKHWPQKNSDTDWTCVKSAVKFKKHQKQKKTLKIFSFCCVISRWRDKIYIAVRLNTDMFW